MINDQRRAFSDEYVNFPLIISNCTIEILNLNPIAQLENVKKTSCILVSSQIQLNNEAAYYRDFAEWERKARKTAYPPKKNVSNRPKERA